MTINILATDLNFPESPTFDDQGNIWFTEILGGNLVKFDRKNLHRIHCGGNVNGCVLDSKGNIWFTDSINHKLRHWDIQKGQFLEISSGLSDGSSLSRPNDLAFDKKGNLIFSCHADGRKEPLAYLAVANKDNQVKKIMNNKLFTNGIAFGPNGDYFIYSETYGHRLWKAYWNDKHLSIIHEEQWAHADGPTGPDGICFDEEENLYVTVYGQSCILIFDKHAKLLDKIELPYKNPTSCAIDPAGELGLVITEAEKGLLINIDLKIKPGIIFKR